VGSPYGRGVVIGMFNYNRISNSVLPIELNSVVDLSVVGVGATS